MVGVILRGLEIEIQSQGFRGGNPQVQNMVRDDGQRTLLFDLDTAIRQLNQDARDHPSALHLTGVYHNLMRRWADL
jgi:predicted 2-oxoglutarate/Fe(II)-dependent dioxygenase YbiX